MGSLFNIGAIEMRNLLGKSVSIQTIDNQQHNGVLYVIDPVFKTLVLIPDDKKCCVEFVLYHAVKRFDVIADAVDEDYQEHLQSGSIDEEAIERKQRLSRWLKQMLLSVEEDGECLLVEKLVRISAPYKKEDCLCDNTIILRNILNIIDSMPRDFQ